MSSVECKRQPWRLSVRSRFQWTRWKTWSRRRFRGNAAGKPIWRAVRFSVARKRLCKVRERILMLGVMSVVEWKLISKLVRRAPTVERAEGGVFSRFSAASGHICGAMNRMELQVEFSSDMARIVTARVQAGSQFKQTVSV